MKNSAFDQYQRYNNIRNIINEMRCDNEKFRILEVGANEHRNLEKFLPLDRITYLDIQLPEELQHDPNYILGDATDMDFPDGEYDVIVALDVFEHIPFEKRNQFIDELYRVSSQICIITAPFHSQESVDAESRVNSIYKSLFGEDYIWLAEHMENGLPDKDALKGYLQTKNVKYKMIGHGRLNIWEKLIGFHFFAAKNPELAVYRQEIDKFYNSYIFDYDYTEDSYRKIVILEKGRSLDLSFEVHSEIPTKTFETLEMMERTFYNLCSMIGSSKDIDLTGDKVQMFIDSGQGFTESSSTKFRINDGELKTNISVDLRNFGEIKSIRIDPSDYSGFYKVENLKMVSAASESELKYLVMGNFNFEYNGVYLFEKDDPNIILNFDSEVDVENIEFQVKKLSMDEIVNQYMHMLTNKELEIININNEYKLIEENERQLLQENKDYLKASEDFTAQVEKLNREINQLREACNINETVKQGILQQLELKENELVSIYNSKAWKLVVKVRSLLGK